MDKHKIGLFDIPLYIRIFPVGHKQKDTLHVFFMLAEWIKWIIVLNSIYFNLVQHDGDNNDLDVKKKTKPFEMFHERWLSPNKMPRSFFPKFLDPHPQEPTAKDRKTHK